MVPRAVPTTVVALGLALVVAGVVMLTLAAPPQRVGGPLPTAGGLVVSDPGVLALTGRPVTVAVEGGGAGTGVFLGREDEVRAWLGGASYTRLTGVAAIDRPAVEAVAGGGGAPDPAEADVWQREATGPGAELRVEGARPTDVVVVAAGDGGTAEVVWDRPARHPGAWPLVAGGALLAAVGLRWLVVLNRRLARRRRSVRGAGAGVRR
ncbi:hypothetical protein [Aquipuribacter nitratireducens]|uniref:Uncharacterized protein n=1 Tax=Aquipuribacter nitratireducens TaxID=650104 RepID=A0ABW0GKV4_9MICO